MFGRLLIGIIKGLLVGALLGFGLTLIGLAAPAWFIAYPAAALAGVLVGLIAGKPIWAADARIEAGLKAFAGALLGAGLMFAVRKWLTMEIPVPMGQLGGANKWLGEAATFRGSLGGLAITSLAMISIVLGAFYEVDNDPSEGQGSAGAAQSKKTEATRGPRVAAESAEDEVDEDLTDEPEKKRERK